MKLRSPRNAGGASPTGARRILAAALTLPLALAACGEQAGPESNRPATTAAVTATATLTATATATSSETATATDTATATATATAEPTASATASAKPVASATKSSKPQSSSGTSTKPADTGSPASTATAAASGTGAPSAKPVELAPPAEGSADAIAVKVDSIFTPKKNFTAKFKQKLEQKVSGTKKEATGNLSIERPNKASFKYDAPNKNRMVSDGKTFKAYVAEDSQMFESKVDSSQYAGGLAFFMGGLFKTMSFTFNTKADYKDGYVLVGKPRTPSPSYEMAMFYVNKALLEKGDPNCIERVVIIDAQGNKNRFDFTSASFPDSIPATEWEFTPPAGTNITKN